MKWQRPVFLHRAQTKWKSASWLSTKGSARYDPRCPPEHKREGQMSNCNEPRAQLHCHFDDQRPTSHHMHMALHGFVSSNFIQYNLYSHLSIKQTTRISFYVLSGRANDGLSWKLITIIELMICCFFTNFVYLLVYNSNFDCTKGFVSPESPSFKA